MAKDQLRDSMLDMFIFETMQLIEQLEQSVLSSEKTGDIYPSIDEIFRIMHTLKGNSAMMLFNNISTLAHSVEDLFGYLREKKPENIDTSKITDLVLEALDFIKEETICIEQGNPTGNEASELKEKIYSCLQELKGAGEPEDKEKTHQNTTSAVNEDQKFYIGPQKKEVKKYRNHYSATIHFEDDCQMENMRAFVIIHNLEEIASDIEYYPIDVIENDESSEVIRKDGFKIIFRADMDYEAAKAEINKAAFIKSFQLKQLEDENDKEVLEIKNKISEKASGDRDVKVPAVQAGSHQEVLSVNVSKLDMLMDLVGELVISESMVTHNPDLEGLNLDNFNKASRQLRKIINDIQDIVMSVRMVPLAGTFQKMNRLVRDMNKKLNKEVELQIIGETTEVDKNIIEHISDPLMHIIRNSMDHGIETTEERIAKGKSRNGTITLEAKNAGGDVWILVKDDGKGLNREKILRKAMENGLIGKAESEITDKEIYNFIFLPGFSTKDKVTEFSGRGVGMDVVVKNLEMVRGNVTVDSIPEIGTTMTIKIPLTLAIIDGMTIKVGNSKYTIPTTSIKESFKIADNELIRDPDGNEMLMVRGECYPLIRINQRYRVKDSFDRLSDGIIIMVEDEDKTACLFADALLGEQQVVVKALPAYIKKVNGVAGCTLLGDGAISLIIDVAGLIAI